MTTATTLLLALLTVLAGPAWSSTWPRSAAGRERWALVLLVLMALAGITAVAALAGVRPGSAPAPWSDAALVAAGVLAALTGGGPVTEAVLRRAASGASPAIDPGTEGTVLLRGGAWIGALERVGVCVAVLAAAPEGVAVVLAVKGLGRYPELRHPGASERFIIGTLASLLWAGAAAGVVLLAL